MATKHDILTFEEVVDHEISWPIEELIKLYQEKTGKKNQEISILDWSCGRGKSVFFY